MLRSNDCASTDVAKQRMPFRRMLRECASHDSNYKVGIMIPIAIGRNYEVPITQ